ncbi:hypothetical protein WDW37_04265 [Bdellovibrionota bacterium FG-1]
MPSAQADEAGISAAPVADLECRLDSGDRAARIRHVEQVIRKLDTDLVAANASLKTLQDALDSMNDAATEAKTCMGIALVAGTVAGVGAVYEVFFSGEAVSFFGITSQSAIRTITAAGAASRTVSLPATVIFLLNDKPVYAAELPLLQREKVNELRDQKFFSESVTRFLSSADCNGANCVTDQQQIENDLL